MSKQFNRQRRHNNSNRSTRSVALQQITRYTNLDSSGPLGKLRGTPLQLAEKYQAGAKDAQTQGDDVLFQTCQQYADHYLRLQALAIENEQAKDKTEEKQEKDISENQEETFTEAFAEVKEESDQPVVVEKKHSKKQKDSLSMPMDALQAQSENNMSE